jgi:hypothetical protein
LILRIAAIKGWRRGHAGNLENERCDRLAMAALRQPNLPADEGCENRPKIDGVRPDMQEGDFCHKARVNPENAVEATDGHDSRSPLVFSSDSACFTGCGWSSTQPRSIFKTRSNVWDQVQD